MRAVSHLPVDLSIAADVMTLKGGGRVELMTIPPVAPDAATTDARTTHAPVPALATSVATMAAVATSVARDQISRARRVVLAVIGMTSHRLAADLPTTTLGATDQHAVNVRRCANTPTPRCGRAAAHAGWATLALVDARERQSRSSAVASGEKSN